jgi:transcriptional regulator with XRE-family HTH domain
MTTAFGPNQPGFALYRTIGQKIRVARRARNMSQARLAELLDMSRASIVNIEAGRQRLPIDLLYDIADIFRIEARSLLPDNAEV